MMIYDGDDDRCDDDDWWWCWLWWPSDTLPLVIDGLHKVVWELDAYDDDNDDDRDGDDEYDDDDNDDEGDGDDEYDGHQTQIQTQILMIFVKSSEIWLDI